MLAVCAKLHLYYVGVLVNELVHPISKLAYGPSVQQFIFKLFVT